MAKEDVTVTEVWHGEPEMMFVRKRKLLVYYTKRSGRYIYFQRRRVSLNDKNEARVDLYPKENR